MVSLRKNKGWFKKGHRINLGVKRHTSGMKGKKHTEEWKKNMRKIMKGRKITWGDKISLAKKGKKDSAHFGEENCNWKGNKVGYEALHSWVIRHLGKPSYCQNREKQFLPFECSGKSQRFELANKDHKYKRDLKDWFFFCRSCHRKYDIRFNGYKKCFK